jgi:hypothetical protein
VVGFQVAAVPEFTNAVEPEALTVDPDRIW